MPKAKAKTKNVAKPKPKPKKKQVKQETFYIDQSLNNKKNYKHAVFTLPKLKGVPKKITVYY
jgi:hypothetical protein